jgi:hypothetical protein
MRCPLQRSLKRPFVFGLNNLRANYSVRTHQHRGKPRPPLVFTRVGKRVLPPFGSTTGREYRVGSPHALIRQSERDDLKKIFGIWPVLERLLNRLGVFHCRDIAHWPAADIQRVDALLENFRGRIARDRWIEGAKEQHSQKYQEKI